MSASVQRELQRVRAMPYGTARTAAAETLARRIEAQGPRESLAAVLLDLVEAYSFADDGAKSFVVFARLLRLWDDSPELFDAADERNLFWEFKWIAGDLPDFPQITRAQAESFLADMTRRFELAGHGLSSVRMCQFRWAWHTGMPGADELRLRWVTGLRDDFEDCRACTIGQQVDFLTETGRYAEAVELGRTQDSSCNLEPTRTHYALALSALLAGDPELALTSHGRAAASDDGGDTGFAPARGQGFEMLARGGRIEQALRILRNEHRALLRRSSTPLFRLRFLIGVLAGLSAVQDRRDLATGIEEDGLRTVGELHAWVRDEAEALAAPLDARNGTAKYADLIVRALAAKPADTPLPEFRIAGGAGDTGRVGSGELRVSGTEAPGSNADGADVTGADAEPDDEAPAAPAQDAERRAEEVLAHAEHAASRGNFTAAVRSYTAAAELLAQSGRLARSGAALAEGAQNAALAGEDEVAHRLFAAAIPELRVGDSDPDVVVAVLAAWVPVAARMGDPAEHIARTVEALDGIGEQDPAGLQQELADRRAAERDRRRASLRDTLARAIAAADGSDLPATVDRGRAVREAIAAGEGYAELGLVADASHAFWLAGRLRREEGDAEGALWALESAFEGFTLARDKTHRAEAAGELIELLRATGRSVQADEITAQLIE